MDAEREGAPRRGPWVVSAIVGLLAVTAAVMVQQQPPAYQSEAVVSLEPRATGNVPPASTITLLTAPYAAYAGADSTLQAVAQDEGLDVTEVREGVAVSLPAGSTNVEIAVTLADGTDAVRVAGRIAADVVAFGADDRTLRATIQVPPTSPDETLLSRAEPVLVPLGLGVGVALLVLGVAMLLAPVWRGRRRADTEPQGPEGGSDLADAPEAPAEPSRPVERPAVAGPPQGPAEPPERPGRRDDDPRDDDPRDDPRDVYQGADIR